MRVKAVNRGADRRHGIKYAQKAGFTTRCTGEFNTIQTGSNRRDNVTVLTEYPIGKVPCRTSPATETEYIKLYLFDGAGTIACMLK